MSGPGGSYVYFIRRADGEGPIKIGCSKLPEGRLFALAAWAPYPLSIAARIDGDLTLERRFHGRFAHLHSHREWFRADPELDEVISRVAAGTFDIASLPEPKSVTWTPRKPPIVRPSVRAESAVARTLRETGLNPPLELLALIRRMDSLRGDDLQAAKDAVQAFRRDPWNRGGRLAEYPWCATRYAEAAQRRGWPPLAIARAA